jgi:hypothetical protein
MDLVEERKDLMTVTVDDLFNDCIRGLKDCFAMRPGWVAKARAELFPDEEAG